MKETDKWNETQKLKRIERNEIRTNIRIPNNLLIKIKIEAYEQSLKTNTYVKKILETAVKNINPHDQTIKNFNSPEDYDDLKPLQVILPRHLLTSIKIFSLLIEEAGYYTTKVNGITTKGRSMIDLLYSGMLLDKENLE